jgi:flagellar biosynthetic protein FliO
VEMIQPIIAVIFVIGLLLTVLFVLRKKGALTFAVPQTGKRLEVVERISLGPNQALHLVRAGDRCVLIATAPSSCQVLDFFVERMEK